MTLVNGDLEDHPEFHEGYDVFLALHYDSDTYDDRGAFWGRASASQTSEADDRLGTAVWTAFQALPGAPPPHFERNNVNVTSYYGFVLTTPQTPGALVELGVGNRRPEDFTWLRENEDAIAEAVARGVAAFGGMSVPDQYLTGAQFNAYTAALQRQLDETYATRADLAGLRIVGPVALKSAVPLRKLTAAQKAKDGHGRPPKGRKR